MRILALIAVTLAFGLVALAALAKPQAPAGIRLTLKFGRSLGKIHKGECTVRGGVFSFSGNNANASLYVEIGNWKGYGKRYQLTPTSKGRIKVISNAGDQYNTRFTVPGSNTAGVAADVLFRHKGATVSVGAPDLPNSDFSDFLKAQGEAACTK